MRSVVPIRVAKFINILLASCFCVFGIVAIAMSEIDDFTVCLVVGILLILSGIFKLVGYLSKDLFRLAFQYDSRLGFVPLLLGLAALLKPDHATDFICAVFGLSAFIEGLFKISVAIDSKKFGIKIWLVILTAAIVSCIYGALLLIFSFESVKHLNVHLGVCLILIGLLNLTVVFGTVKIIGHQQPDKPAGEEE